MLGNYNWMFVDITGRTTFSPVQDSSMPLYLGTSPDYPAEDGHFTMGRRGYKVLRVLEPSTRFNPFPVPLVVATREGPR